LKEEKIEISEVFRIWKDGKWFFSQNPPQEGSILLNSGDGYFKCSKCEDYIHWDTIEEVVFCHCKSIAVQGYMLITGTGLVVLPQKN